MGCYTLSTGSLPRRSLWTCTFVHSKTASLWPSQLIIIISVTHF